MLAVRCMLMRARAAVLAVWKADPVCWNVDQKPFHMNEAGSKCKETMSFKGESEIELHELHSHTRARWSANTCCISDAARAAQIPPLEILFKGAASLLACRANAEIVSW